MSSGANHILTLLTDVQLSLSELTHCLCTVGEIVLDTSSQDEQIVAGARHELLLSEQPPDESLRRRHARQRLGRNVVVVVAGVASPAQSFQSFRSESYLRYDADQQVVDLVIQRRRQLDVLAAMGRAHVLRFCNERRREVRYRDRAYTHVGGLLRLIMAGSRQCWKRLRVPLCYSVTKSQHC